MFELWGKNKKTKKVEKIGKPFYDSRLFHSKVDEVDRNEYEWVMIIEEQNCLFYQEFKDYRSYYEKIRKKK